MEKNGTKRSANFSREVGSKEIRKIRARKTAKRSVWFGFGMFGLIGWSVVVPMLLGAALGLWLDKHYPVEFSWTLTLLLGGVVIGCMNAWFWIDKENREIHKELEENDQ